MPNAAADWESLCPWLVHVVFVGHSPSASLFRPSERTAIGAAAIIETAPTQAMVMAIPRWTLRSWVFTASTLTVSGRAGWSGARSASSSTSSLGTSRRVVCPSAASVTFVVHAFFPGAEATTVCSPGSAATADGELADHSAAPTR